MDTVGKLMYFGGTEGLNIFDPEKVNRKSLQIAGTDNRFADF
jgi:hypothetical protein